MKAYVPRTTAVVMVVALGLLSVGCGGLSSRSGGRGEGRIGSIAITADNAILINGRPTSNLADDDALDQLAQARDARGMSPDEVELVIEGDARADCSTLAQVFDACRAKHWERFRLVIGDRHFSFHLPMPAPLESLQNPPFRVEVRSTRSGAIDSIQIGSLETRDVVRLHEAMSGLLTGDAENEQPPVEVRAGDDLKLRALADVLAAICYRRLPDGREITLATNVWPLTTAGVELVENFSFDEPSIDPNAGGFDIDPSTPSMDAREMAVEQRNEFPASDLGVGDFTPGERLPADDLPAPSLLDIETAPFDGAGKFAPPKP